MVLQVFGPTPADDARCNAVLTSAALSPDADNCSSCGVWNAPRSDNHLAPARGSASFPAWRYSTADGALAFEQDAGRMRARSRTRRLARLFMWGGI